MIFPNNAKCAFAFGFDLDGDTIWINKIKKLPEGMKYIKSRSIGRYGPNCGMHHVLDILREYDLKSTWFIPTDTIEHYPDKIELILKEGHEISFHGLDHTGDYGETLEQQQAKLLKGQELFRKYTGGPARGARPTGSLLPETFRWMLTEGGFDYISRDQQYEGEGWFKIDGEPTPGVDIPCRETMMDDYTQTVMQSYPQVLPGMPRIQSYDVIYANWIRELEGMARFGHMGSAAFHPQVSGSVGRSMILDRLCRYIAESPDIWCTTALEIALHFKSQQKGGAADA